MKLHHALAIALTLLTASVWAAEPRQTRMTWEQAVADPAAAHLARPSKVQYDWQEMERAMFIQLDPATHQGREYDNGSTPMEQLTFEKLDVNQWCEAAKAWGAKEVNFMLAHSGGFCMWPTETTDYHIGNTPYKGGKGDVVKEFAEACRKHGLKAGFFIWSPLSKEHQAFYGNYWTHGSDDTPVTTAEESSAVTAVRLRELHERLGSDLVAEIWLDLPRFLTLGKEVEEYFPNAVVLAVGCQSPLSTIRWPGTESGTVSDPCWSVLVRSNMIAPLSNPDKVDPGNSYTNDKQTQAADDPDGDYWAPHEADTPLHNHYWHMRPGALENRKSVEQLTEVYEKSVGRNSFIILNCAPMKDGSIHPDDMKRYKEFGDEIERRFGRPLAVVEQVPGKEVVLDLGGMQKIDYSDLWEDHRYGHRIREYVVEGFDGEEWFELARGTAVGRRKIDPFAPETVSKVRVRVTKSVGTPLIRKFQVHFADVKKNRRAVVGRASASSEHEAKLFPPKYAVDGNPGTYWVTDIRERDKTPTLTLDLGRKRKIGRASLSEAFEPRIKKFRIEGRLKKSDPWVVLHNGSAVNGKWEGDIEETTVRFVRLTVEEFSNINIGVREFAVTARPAPPNPSIKAPRDRSSRLPPPQCNLALASPVQDWWEALPLGNGQLGALIWGQGNRLTVKLDRVDVWDERVGHPSWKTDEFTWKTIQKYRAAGNFARIHEIFDNHYHNEPPTHVAMGKLELTLPEGMVADTFRLDLAKAEVRIDYQDGTAVKSIASATEPVIMMLIPGKLDGFDIWAPGMNDTWMKSLGYPSPQMHKDADSVWYVQSIQEGPTFAVFAKRKTVGNDTLIAITITTNQEDGPDPVAAARKRTDRALGIGYEKLLAAHRKYWAGFWNTSALDIPDQAALNHYYLTRYYFGSSSRPGFPAMGTLQSVWTDEKQWPAFKNNVHNDLESQVQYQAYQTAGNFAEGEAFFEYWWQRLPVFRTYAKSFYETDGAAVPGVMTWGGHPTTGWPQYANSPTQVGWIGWLFYQHWRYTQDREFLAKRAYPWCAEMAECWDGLLEPDENGIRKLPLSTSAEVFNNSPRSWMKPNTNYDLDLMQVHLLGLAEMAQELGKKEEAARWSKMANSLGSRHVDEENALMWSENEKVAFLHRHFSHSMSIHPFNLLTIDGADRDREIIAGTMKRYDQLSVDADFAGDWAGWSFPWMSSLRARVGQGEEAWRHLDLFLDGWIMRNGFHMNSNRGGTKASGHGFFFTIEANIEATQAVHDMLIQSWAPSIGQGEPGIIRIFPAMPESWKDAWFDDLRAEGGFKVSAERKDGQTVEVRIEATVDGPLRLRDPFPGRTATWNPKDLPRDGNNYTIPMRRGQILQGKIGLVKWKKGTGSEHQ